MKKELSRFLCLVLLFIVQLSWAQTFLPIVEYNGKTCHVIDVTEGLTLFAIVQQTGFSGDEIVKNNPGSNNGLQIGQKLYLPAVRKNIVHKVSEKETLFAISKRYLVSVDSLLSWNVDSDKGIQVSQNVYVKNALIRIDDLKQNDINVKITRKDSINYHRNFEFDDTLLIHIVKAGESIYTLSKRYMVSIDIIKNLNGLKNNQLKVGSSLTIPINQSISIVQGPKEIVSKVETKAPIPIIENRIVVRDLNIAIFLPFGVDSIKYPMNGTSKAAVEFYLGSLLGISDLEANGLTGKVTFYDYFSESSNFPEVLLSGELNEVDLVYAPFHSVQAQLVADFCLKNKIRIVFPINLTPCFYQANPYAIQVPTSKINLAINLAKDIYDLQNGEQIILIRSEKTADSLMEEAFLRAYHALPKIRGKAKIIYVNPENYIAFSNNDLKTWYVSFSSEKDKVISFLKSTSEMTNVDVFGLKEWLEYKEISSTISNVFTFNYESSSYFNYKSDAVISFHKRYRKAYQSDVSKMACLGYDMLTLIPQIFLLNEADQEGTISKLAFFQETPGSLMENKASFLLKFIDFETIKYLDEVK
jgi:LysM repeat protein